MWCSGRDDGNEVDGALTRVALWAVWRMLRLHAAGPYRSGWCRPAAAADGAPDWWCLVGDQNVRALRCFAREGGVRVLVGLLVDFGVWCSCLWFWVCLGR